MQSLEINIILLFAIVLGKTLHNKFYLAYKYQQL